MIGRLIRALAALAVVVPLLNTGAQAINENIARANQDTVGIISGSVTGTYARFAENLADALDQEGELRVIAMLGKGSVQNLTDLLYLRGVDVAIVQSDVLSYFRKYTDVSDIEDKIAYITKLYNEEIHILARSHVRSIKDLSDQAVNVGPVGSGTSMTASLVFRALDVPVQETHMSNSEALAALQRGELAAAVFIVGKPAAYFREIVSTQDLHFLNVEMEKGLEETYFGAQLTHEDYPDLIAEDDAVDTIAVGAVMAVYNWKEGTNRHDRTARFVRSMFDHLDKLRSPAYHPKWGEVDITADLTGWQRFAAAQRWLEEKESGL